MKSADSTPSRRPWSEIEGRGPLVPWLVGVSVLYVLVAVLFAKVIYPIDDEAIFANPAYNLINHGHFGTNIIDHNNTLPGIEARTYWFQPLYPLLLSAWFELVPVTPFNQRLLSVGWGFMALAAWFLISRLLTGRNRCALTVALALSLDYTFLSAAGTGRMDMMSAALSWGALALYLHCRDRSLPCAVLLGCSACAVNVVTHPLGAILAVLNLVILFVLLDPSRARLHLLLPAAVPFAVVGGIWAAYIAESPSDFVSQFVNNDALVDDLSLPGGVPTRLSGFANPVHALWMMIGHAIQGLYGPAQLAGRTINIKMFIPLAYLVVVGIAIVSRGIRAQVEIRVILLLCAADFVMIALLNIRGKIQYYVQVLPLLTILVVLVAWRSALLPRSRRFVVVACCAVLLMLNGGRIVHSVLYDAYRTHYIPVQRVLRELIPANASVSASAEWAYVLGFERTLHDETQGFRTGRRPDYIVVDGKEQYDMAIYSQTIPGFREYAEELLSRHYTLIHQDTLVRIYRRLSFAPRT